MKLYQAILTEKKKKGDTSPKKIRPILLAGHNKKMVVKDLEAYWGKEKYHWTTPDMIADFNPR